MDFRLKLEEGHSKKITTAIVNDIGHSSLKLDQLINIFKDGPPLITQRAAWPLSYVLENHPHLADNYYDLFIELLIKKNKHPAINRNILRGLQYAKIPEKHQGNILDICFQLLNSAKETIAVKIFCMTILEHLSREYPEIIPELKTSIKLLLPNASPGIKNRGTKILKAIQE